MPDFSYVYNNQSLSPAPLYPFAGLDPVLLTFNRYDIFTWSAGLRRAIGQLLVTDSGWNPSGGTRVAIVFADGSILYDTVATISESGGNTNLTFTTYNSEVTGSAMILNLDYVGYRMHLRINGTRLVGATAVPFTVEAYAPFSAAGYCSVDVAALVRDRLNTHPEWLSTGARPYEDITAEGPVEDELVTVDIEYRSEATGQMGTWGWNNVGGDTALCKFYNAREYKGYLAEGGYQVPGSPSLYLQSARDYTGNEPLVGGFLIEKGATPRWRTSAAGSGMQRAFYVVTCIWQSDSAASLIVDVDYGVASPASFSLLDNGLYHLWLGKFFDGQTSITLSSAGSGASDTLLPFAATVQECTCPLIYLLWRNSMGGYSAWAFEMVEGQQNIGQRGDLYDSASLDGKGYSFSYQTVSNARQQTIGQFRAPAINEALQITLGEGALTEANVIYLQSILTSQEIFWLDWDYTSSTGQATPVTITAGDAPIRKRANDLYDFAATLNAPLR